MKHCSKLVSIILIFFLLGGCASKRTIPKQVPDTLEGFKNLGYNHPKTKTVGAIRIQALRETALSLGARGGLAHRAFAINQILLNYEPLLNRTFNFHGMLLDHNVLPPVLIESRQTLSLPGTDVLRVSDRSYIILKQACFVTAAPTWRDYLWQNYQKPEIPDQTLLPKNKGEQIIWDKYVEEGWEAGLAQAMVIFQENLARLKRDFEGMIRYRTLLAQNIVSPPYVATMDMGITGGGDSLEVHDRVLRITALPSLNADSSEWKTELRNHE